MKAPATPVVNNPGECSWYGGALKIDIYPNDPTQKYYLAPGERSWHDSGARSG